MSVGDSVTPERIARWRANWINWVMVVPLCAAMLAMSVGSYFAFTAWVARIGMATSFLAFALILTVMVGAYIDLYPDRLVIGGWLRPTKVRPLANIESVRAGRYGLSFRTGPYDGFTGPGLIGGKGDWPPFLRLPAFRGDRIAAQILAQAERARISEPQNH